MWTRWTWIDHAQSIRKIGSNSGRSVPIFSGNDGYRDKSFNMSWGRGCCSGVQSYHIIHESFFSGGGEGEEVMGVVLGAGRKMIWPYGFGKGRTVWFKVVFRIYTDIVVLNGLRTWRQLYFYIIMGWRGRVESWFSILGWGWQKERSQQLYRPKNILAKKLKVIRKSIFLLVYFWS